MTTSDNHASRRDRRPRPLRPGAEGGCALMRTTPRQVDRYEATRWEIVMQANGSQTVLGYTARKTARALFAAMGAHREAVLAALGDDDFAWNTKTQRFEGPGFWVGFSGRTERQAADAMRGAR